MSAIRTDEQRALQDSAAAYLASHVNAREARSGDRAVWQGMADLGWAAVIVPEDCGGLDGVGREFVGARAVPSGDSAEDPTALACTWAAR